MDWHCRFLCALWAFSPLVYGWSAIPSRPTVNERQRSVSPYLDLVFCPIREQPWSCARQQSARILDVWDGELSAQWQKLKVEADQQLNATLEKRGYSNSQIVTKEKPSTILKKIEIGTNYMKKYLAETMDGFLGREYEYSMQDFKNHNAINNDNQNENDNETELEEEQTDDDADDKDDGATNEYEDTEDNETQSEVDKSAQIITDNTALGDNEFIDIEGDEGDGSEGTPGQLKKPGGGNKRRKRKKGEQQHEIATQAANLLVIQPLEHQFTQLHQGAEQLVHTAKPQRNKLKPLKQKRRKRKKKGQHLADDTATIVVEQQPSTDHLGLGLLEELADVDVLSGGGHRKKHPFNYGRSNGVTRGKKKKKKKAIMKLLVVGQVLKAKIELLLKILGAHLQIKFFAIALIGLLINIARFWIDVKRGGSGQKVVYVEHAHHQHHYEDHGDDWSEGGGGKRSLQTDTPEDTYNSSTDSYQPRPQVQQPYDPQYMAYRNQWQRK